MNWLVKNASFWPPSLWDFWPESSAADISLSFGTRINYCRAHLIKSYSECEHTLSYMHRKYPPSPFYNQPFGSPEVVRWALPLPGFYWYPCQCRGSRRESAGPQHVLPCALTLLFRGLCPALCGHGFGAVVSVPH